MTDKVVRNGKVAILYSPGFGAGWYSWNTAYPQILTHPTLVEMVEKGEQHHITNEFMEKLLGVDYFYAGGASDLEIEWVDEGCRFRIQECDGNESVEILSPDDYFRA